MAYTYSREQALSNAALNPGKNMQPSASTNNQQYEVTAGNKTYTGRIVQTPQGEQLIAVRTVTPEEQKQAEYDKAIAAARKNLEVSQASTTSSKYIQVAQPQAPATKEEKLRDVVSQIQARQIAPQVPLSQRITRFDITEPQKEVIKPTPINIQNRTKDITNYSVAPEKRNIPRESTYKAAYPYSVRTAKIITGEKQYPDYTMSTSREVPKLPTMQPNKFFTGAGQFAEETINFAASPIIYTSRSLSTIGYELSKKELQKQPLVSIDKGKITPTAAGRVYGFLENTRYKSIGEQYSSPEFQNTVIMGAFEGANILSKKVTSPFLSSIGFTAQGAEKPGIKAAAARASYDVSQNIGNIFIKAPAAIEGYKFIKNPSEEQGGRLAAASLLGFTPEIVGRLQERGYTNRYDIRENIYQKGKLQIEQINEKVNTKLELGNKISYGRGFIDETPIKTSYVELSGKEPFVSRRTVVYPDQASRITDYGNKRLVQETIFNDKVQSTEFIKRRLPRIDFFDTVSSKFPTIRKIKTKTYQEGAGQQKVYNLLKNEVIPSQRYKKGVQNIEFQELSGSKTSNIIKSGQNVIEQDFIIRTDRQANFKISDYLQVNKQDLINPDKELKAESNIITPRLNFNREFSLKPGKLTYKPSELINVIYEGSGQNIEVSSFKQNKVPSLIDTSFREKINIERKDVIDFSLIGRQRYTNVKPSKPQSINIYEGGYKSLFESRIDIYNRQEKARSNNLEVKSKPKGKTVQFLGLETGKINLNTKSSFSVPMMDKFKFPSIIFNQNFKPQSTYKGIKDQNIKNINNIVTPEIKSTSTGNNKKPAFSLISLNNIQDIKTGSKPQNLQVTGQQAGLREPNKERTQNVERIPALSYNFGNINFPTISPGIGAPSGGFPSIGGAPEQFGYSSGKKGYSFFSELSLSRSFFNKSLVGVSSKSSNTRKRQLGKLKKVFQL